MEEKFKEAPRDYSLLAIAGFILAVLAGITAISAGFGNRLGIWNFRTGMLILRWAAYCGGIAGVTALIGAILTRPGSRHRGFSLALLGLLIAFAVTGLPWSFWRYAKLLPAIHDITTDTENPPSFRAVLPLRKGLNLAEYGGPKLASQQRAAYPDIVPLELPLPPEQAFQKALSAARALGWRIVAAEDSQGSIEATDTTFWFGFHDDIVVRIKATKQGSRIDVRSLSRVGKSDLGTNAQRIRKYFRTLKETG